MGIDNIQVGVDDATGDRRMSKDRQKNRHRQAGREVYSTWQRYGCANNENLLHTWIVGVEMPSQ